MRAVAEGVRLLALLIAASYEVNALVPGFSDMPSEVPVQLARLPVSMLTLRSTRALPDPLSRLLCAFMTPESSTAMPTPLPSAPVYDVLLP